MIIIIFYFPIAWKFLALVTFHLGGVSCIITAGHSCPWFVSKESVSVPAPIHYDQSL